MSETTTGPAPIKLSWWVSGDTNAFFGLGFNTLVNVLVLSGLCVGVVKIPGTEVFGVILPALGVQLLIGNVYYTYLARRLARRENRTDVCAMPYGPSVPHMFIVTFVVMLPIHLATNDPIAAWAAGLAWSFIIGLIVLAGAFVGPYIRRYTPQAAMLGTLAGISIAFISMRPAAQMWEALWIALPVMVIILIGFFTDLRLPGNIPVGLAALLLGSAIGWIGGYMSVPDVVAAARDVALSLPSADLGRLGDGLADVAPLLATAIPLGIYNFTEGITNVESAAVAGDEYNLRSILLADGTGAVVGSALGCLVLGAIVAFIIDKKFVPAAVYCFTGAALGFIGLIHAERVGWNVGGQIALGYLLAGLILLGFGLVTRARPGSARSGAAGEVGPGRAEVPAQRAGEPAAAAAPIDTTRPATA